jgi:molybdopterin synthase sulfur carrier subunit
MPRVVFAKAFQRHVSCPPLHLDAGTIGELLDSYFTVHPLARGYVLDDTGSVRKHVAVFVNSEQIADRGDLTGSLTNDDEVYVFQALSGG